MKILLNWLRDYIDIHETPEKIADALLMAGIEVESIHQPGKAIKNVVSGKILSRQPHPNADKLSLCQVDVGKGEPLSIVCGATNMQPGDIVPVAMIGATLPSGMEIRRAKLRGVESFGMMCSRKELGISEEHAGLYILPPETPLGKDIAEILGLNEVVFEISITPNRGDALSHLGIARELSAIFNLPMHRGALDNSAGRENVAQKTSVTNEAPHACPRYGARVVENVKIGPSPKWLKERLEQVGVRSINNVVDITNYIMLDIGHPMHAFDLEKLDENRIVVRMARSGEKFTTLDKIERSLDPMMLVIADASKPVALAGVMGGLQSEVTDQTTRILLEAAYFEPTCIRKTAKTLGMMSESSYRFERGTNIDNIPIALNMAARMIQELAGGQPLEGLVDSYPSPKPLRRIHVRPRRVSQLLGIDFRAPQIETFLYRLKFEVTRDGEDLWVGVPPYRHDIEAEVDIIEEVARIFGYGHIPTTLPSITSSVQPQKSLFQFESRVRDFMLTQGFSEIITYSFIPNSTPETLQEGIPFKLKNPISEDHGILRTSLFPGMFGAIRHNVMNDEYDLRFFEIGRVFHRGSGDQCQELDRLSIGVSGRANPLDWKRNNEQFDLFAMKGLIQSLTTWLGQSPEFKPGTRETLHPTQQLEIRCQGKLLGHLGKIHPRHLDNKKFPENIILVELDLGILSELPKTLQRMKPIPEFPSIRRDIALIAPVETLQGDLHHMIVKEGGKLLEQCNLFDVYQGKGVEPGKKSLAFSLIFRSPERTLTDEEVQPVVDALVGQAARQFNTKLRTG